MTATKLAVIRGPKDKDQFRNDPDNWTGYIDPLPADNIGEPFDTPVDSVSTKKQAWPKGFLTQWMVEQAAACAVDNYGTWASMDPPDAIKWIAAASDRQRDAAADRGHQVHHLLETLLDGGNFDGPLDINDATPYLDTLRLIVEKESPEVVASEVVVYGRWDDPNGIPHEWMGTFDAVWRVDARLVLVDYKSRKHGKAASRHPEEGAQVGGYSMASYWIVEDDTGIRRMAPMQIDAGMVLSIAPDGYRKYWIDDIEQARHAWKRTLMFKHTIDSARLMFGRAVGHNVEGGDADDPHGEGTAVLAAAPVAVGSVEDHQPVAAPVTSPTDDVSPSVGDNIHHQADVAWLINRTLNIVKATSKQHVAQVWPVDIARPGDIKTGAAEWTPGDIDLIVTALDALEAKHDLPFGPPRPSIAADQAARFDAKIEADTTPPPKLTPAPDDDGPAPESYVLELKRLAGQMQQSPDPAVRARIARAQLWQRDANTADVPWRTGLGPGGSTPMRVWAIGRAAIACTALVDLTADDPDYRVRVLLERCAPNLPSWPDGWPGSFPVGALFGSLTTDQAIALWDTAGDNQ